MPTLTESIVYLLRRLTRASDVAIDGVLIKVDYARWSPLMIRSVLLARYEAEERQLVPRIVHEGDRVLEIGGGVGLIAMLCARICGQGNVVVYEANPTIRETALSNVRHNGMTIAIEHAAVVGRGHAGDTVRFYVSEHFWSSSLLANGKSKQVEISAPALRLDALIERHRPTVIIADVEGAEYDILLDADLSSVHKLCVEFHTRYLGVLKVSDLIRSLLERGFQLQLEQSIGEVLYFSRAAA